MAEPVNRLELGARAINMSKRRALILSCAQAIIAKQGFDALKIRDLAAQSKLTVPTIYNLIGGKNEILALMIEDLVKRLTAVQPQLPSDDIEKAFENQIDGFVELFASDESYYRAAFIAGDRSGLFEQHSATGIFAQSVLLPIEACKSAVQAGLLNGGISSEQLGRQIYGCYRLARQDWALGHFDLEQFRRQALTGILVCLASDAVADFHQRLMQRIASL